MLRLASLAFVLRAGIKHNNLPHAAGPPIYRTIQARIDTILYQRLQLAEVDLHARLQRIIFRTAGNLSRHQLYPVALVLWQLLRILCIGASHLSNIVTKYQSRDGTCTYTDADHQYHGLCLVMSTHTALFRTGSPLLLDFEDPFNRDLLAGDNEIIGMAMVLRKVVLRFRKKGFPDLKGSVVWRKTYFDQMRGVFGGT